jgi:hypothetical protein
MKKISLIMIVILLNSCACFKAPVKQSINVYSKEITSKPISIKDTQKVICVSNVVGKTKQINAVGYFVKLYLERSGFKVTNNLNACFYKLDINLTSISGNNQSYQISSNVSLSKKINLKNSLIMSDLSKHFNDDYTNQNNWDSKHYQIKVIANNINLNDYLNTLAIQEHLAKKIVNLTSK